jgi:hypothetical protein
MKHLTRKEIIDSQTTGSIYDAKGYTGNCGYSDRLKENVVSRFSDPRQKSQGVIRQRLIDDIDARGLEIAAMLTVSPYKQLDLSDRNALMEYIFHSTCHRYHPRNRKPIYLAFYEQNRSNPGYHMHLLFFKLPQDKSCLGKATLTKGVAQAVGSVTGMDSIPPVHLDHPQLHADLYNYAIRNPYDPDGRKGHLYWGRKYIPKSRQGLKWSVVGTYQLDVEGKPRNSFDGFYAAHGLVAYCTKRIFTDADLSNSVDSYSYNALINSPMIEKSNAVDLSTFFANTNA